VRGGHSRAGHSVDVTAGDALMVLHDALQVFSIQLCFAEMKDPVKDKLKRFGIFGRLGEQNFFSTINEAVDTYLARHP
jgi:MFS superfamily sulfate permease-like transporter